MTVKGDSEGWDSYFICPAQDTAPNNTYWPYSHKDMENLHLLMLILTLKAPIVTAADDIYIYFFIVFQRK